MSVTLDAPPPDLVADLLGCFEQALHNSVPARCEGSWSLAAAAFAADSTVRPLALGEGLWAVLRESPDGGVQALCVHNITGRPAEVALTGWSTDTAELRFVRGDVRTSRNEAGDLVCLLDPWNYTWLCRRVS